MTEDLTTVSITSMRHRIDEIDSAIIQLWQERAELSHRIGAIRIAAGGTRRELSHEQQIMNRFRDGIGAEGPRLALLVLRASHEPL